MSNSLLRNCYSDRSFPPFSLTRLIQTVFAPKGGERVCILIDLPDPALMKDFAFLQHPEFTIQKHAHNVFFEGLRKGGLAELGLRGGDLFAYEITGGSNLDLPETLVDARGQTLCFKDAVFTQFDLILCISTYSATAPLTAFAKEFGFRGATMHGMNEIILSTGLAVDYDAVSAAAEKLRLGMTHADWVEIDYEVLEQKATLRLDLGRQDAQKSHGLCRGGPDVANLPAGEIYFVPENATGTFPMRYEDGTLGMMRVQSGRIVESTLLRGNPETIRTHNEKLTSDPLTGELGELGFGTQELPPSGKDIQDEKILGTLHVATGRSDHLGGRLTPDRFKTRKNATHDDILFSSTKTPEIRVPQARLHRHGQTLVILENYSPSDYLRSLLAGKATAAPAAPASKIAPVPAAVG
jgi:aminopeptidase